MRVLIIGSGGREHAIAAKIVQSPLLTQLYCAPGNPGTAQISTNLKLDIKNFEAIKEAVVSNNINLVVVGPEDPLVNGLGDLFRSDEALKNVLFVGPSRDGAMLEGSKEYAKEFMLRYGIPTASYKSFNINQLSQAKEYLRSIKAPYVLKADGLAAGKGVVIVEQLEEALSEVEQMLGGKFGAAGQVVVIEEFLKGIELSCFVLTDGKDYLLLPEAKDYKRIFDGDKGPNTGGMGAVSPVPFADESFINKVKEQIITPTLKGLQKEGIEYKGFIFIGLMNCNGNPYVIEYNVRMGDPETEAVMPRVESDLLSHLVAAASGNIAQEQIKIDTNYSLTLMMVSEGYPGEYKHSIPITLPQSIEEGAHLYYAGTKIEEGVLKSSGGRVLAITAKGRSIEEGRNKIYQIASTIKFDGHFYRKDIGLDLL